MKLTELKNAVLLKMKKDNTIMNIYLPKREEQKCCVCGKAKDDLIPFLRTYLCEKCRHSADRASDAFYD